MAGFPPWQVCWQSKAYKGLRPGIEKALTMTGRRFGPWRGSGAPGEASSKVSEVEGMTGAARGTRTAARWACMALAGLCLLVPAVLAAQTQPDPGPKAGTADKAAAADKANPGDKINAVDARVVGDVQRTRFIADFSKQVAINVF